MEGFAEKVKSILLAIVTTLGESLVNDQDNDNYHGAIEFAQLLLVCIPDTDANGGENKAAWTSGVELYKKSYDARFTLHAYNQLHHDAAGRAAADVNYNHLTKMAVAVTEIGELMREAPHLNPAQCAAVWSPMEDTIKFAAPIHLKRLMATASKALEDTFDHTEETQTEGEATVWDVHGGATDGSRWCAKLKRQGCLKADIEAALKCHLDRNPEIFDNTLDFQTNLVKTVEQYYEQFGASFATSDKKEYEEWKQTQTKVLHRMRITQFEGYAFTVIRTESQQMRIKTLLNREVKRAGLEVYGDAAPGLVEMIKKGLQLKKIE